MLFQRGDVVEDVLEHVEKLGGMFQRMFGEMLGGNLATGGGPYNTSSKDNDGQHHHEEHAGAPLSC